MSPSIGRLVESEIEMGIGSEEVIHGWTDDRVFEGSGGERH
jgi:hypothetical protein